MSVPYRAAVGSTASRSGDFRSKPAQTSRKSLYMRKYNMMSLDLDGNIRENQQIGPAMPMFEQAFSAFARGTLIGTTNGPVAVEDLVPGMEIVTQESGASPLLWTGSMTVVPSAPGVDPESSKLTRIMSDAFGPSRPMPDFMAGPSARVLSRLKTAQGSPEAEQLFIPAREFVDGMQVIEITPPAPVTVYHLCLANHSTINAAGLYVESYHPGEGFERSLGQNMLSLFLSLFPHISEPSDFGRLSHRRFSQARDNDPIFA